MSAVAAMVGGGCDFVLVDRDRDVIMKVVPLPLESFSRVRVWVRGALNSR